MDKNIINLGIWNCPKSWNDITLKTYQEIDAFYKEKENKVDIREIVHILTNHTIDEVNALPIEFLDKILEHLQWLQEEPKYGEPTNKIIIDGETYIANTQEKLKVGEYIAVDSVLKDNQSNYAAILAILCRKQDEAYDSKFENEVLPSRIKMFEDAKLMDVMPVVGFFLQCYMVLQSPILLSLEVQEAINRTRNDILNSRENGEISERCTKRLMKKLSKLEKSINSIL